MATIELSTRPAGAGERLQHLAGMAVARVAAVWRAMQHRRAVAKLLDWDARALRDIGLTPSDLRSALAGPIADDPSARLACMSSERRAAIKAAACEEIALRPATRSRALPRNSYPFADL